MASEVNDLSLLRQQAEQVIERLRQSAEHVEREQHKLMDACISAANWPAVMREAADLIVSLTAREREWQPIETAPKDGTPFIAANRFDAFRAFYHIEQEVWVCEDDGKWFGQLTLPPTHWASLPPVTRSPVSSSEERE